MCSNKAKTRKYTERGMRFGGGKGETGSLGRWHEAQERALDQESGDEVLAPALPQAPRTPGRPLPVLRLAFFVIRERKRSGKSS